MHRAVLNNDFDNSKRELQCLVRDVEIMMSKDRRTYMCYMNVSENIITLRAPYKMTLLRPNLVSVHGLSVVNAVLVFI